MVLRVSVLDDLFFVFIFFLKALSETVLVKFLSLIGYASVPKKVRKRLMSYS